MIKLSEIAVERKISKEIFMSKYNSKEIPVVIKNLTKDWNATKSWSLEYFESLAGEQKVKLYDSYPSKNNKLQHAAEKLIPMKEYFQLLKSGEKNLRMFFYDILREVPTLKEDFSFPDIGLKFFKKLPVMFLGGKGAKVQMHFDIDYADIFLCHFGGKKNVMLFPPSQTKYMYHVPYSFSALSQIDFDNPDYLKYPALKHLKGLKTVLEHGDILYIPPGWWHYITYEDIGYSIALRAFPRKPQNLYNMLRNMIWTRSVEGLMRILVGQKWNDRNEKIALEKTNVIF